MAALSPVLLFCMLLSLTRCFVIVTIQMVLQHERLHNLNNAVLQHAATRTPLPLALVAE